MTERRYRAEVVNEGLLEVVSHYAGSYRPSGRRYAFVCPGCGRRKLEVLIDPPKRVGGCMKADCNVPDKTDALGLIAHFEGLDCRAQFAMVLRKGYEILNLQGGPEGAPRAASTHTPNLPAGGGEKVPKHAPFEPAGPELTDRVYRRLMELCPIVERHQAFWRSRGLTEETVREGRFGSISPTRVRVVEDRLWREFGEDLLGVPGFFKPEDAGKAVFSLREEYTLIPYHDGEGRISAVEGRATSKRALAKSKYRTPLNGGNHLYVFPTFRPGEILAVCEGPIGAIVAAQHGLPVGAIQGVMRYRSAGADAPLPELDGVDLEGRRVAYIPDLDVKPSARADVEAHAPQACEYLVSRRNGRPRIALLPSGKDLDEYLLSAPAEARREAFADLLEGSIPPEEFTLSPPEPDVPPPPAPSERPPVPSGDGPAALGDVAPGEDPREPEKPCHGTLPATPDAAPDGAPARAPGRGADDREPQPAVQADTPQDAPADRAAADGTGERAPLPELLGDGPAAWWGFPERRPSLAYRAPEEPSASALAASDAVFAVAALLAGLLVALGAGALLAALPLDAGGPAGVLAALLSSPPVPWAAGLLTALLAWSHRRSRRVARRRIAGGGPR